MTRIIQLLKQFPLITLLAVMLITCMLSLLMVTRENADLKQQLTDCQTAIPAAIEYSNKVEQIAKDCKAEVGEALSKVKPIIKYIDKPAKSAGEFNEWMENI